MARSVSHISPEKDGGSSSGGGPEDSPAFAPVRSRSHGLLSLAFGFALGLAMLVLFGLISLLKPSVSLPTFSAASAFANLVSVFLFGFVGGTVIAAVYNFLVLRRLNLFGIEHRLD